MSCLNPHLNLKSNTTGRAGSIRPRHHDEAATRTTSAARTADQAVRGTSACRTADPDHVSAG